MATPKINSRTELITHSIDKKAAGALSVNSAQGGMVFQNMSEVLEFSKLMAISQQAVPPHCRNQPGICLGLTIQAIEWRMSPYAVASKSYIVNDRISYESQLIHAVVEQRAPIQSRLRHKFTGEGNKRRCVVWATPKGESEPLEYTSPEFDKITPKNSPLWKTKPDLQLYYNAARDWARAYFPDVIMGVYAEDELLDAAAMDRTEQPKGIAGLKSTLMGPEVELVPDVDQTPPDDAQYVDPPHDDADAIQDDPKGSTVEMTAEELRDHEGQLFATHPRHD